MGSDFTEAQNNLLKLIAKENGFTDFTIESYSTSSKGDNYIGEIKCVTIKSSNKKLDLVVKKAPNDENFRKVFPVGDIFRNEIYVYEKIFDIFANFQNESNLVNPFNSYAKFYGKCEEKYSECLVLENLIKIGYRHWNRRLPMNADHIGIVMKTYGKLHATSFAIKKKNPVLFQTMVDGIRQNEEWHIQNFKSFLRNITVTLQKAVSGYQILENAFQRLMEGLESSMKWISTEAKHEMVLTHGDCWCNNMLFKYEDPDDTEKPTKACLIDWQMLRLGLPLIDISYFICASSPKEILYDYKTYLKIYHDSLSDSLREMSCDPEELFPFQDLEALWKRFGIYGVLVGSFVFRMLYVDSEVAPVVNVGVISMDSFYDRFHGMGNEEKVHGRIRDLLTFMVDNNFI